jgi:DivIVA domain-containing protein
VENLSLFEEYQSKLKFNPQVIIDKEFKKAMRGYDAEDVDSFLDKIIEDYHTFSGIFDALKAENEKLKLQVDEYRKKTNSPSQVSPTNLDILQRLNNLEKHVFGDRLYNK